MNMPTEEIPCVQHICIHPMSRSLHCLAFPWVSWRSHAPAPRAAVPEAQEEAALGPGEREEHLPALGEWLE